MPSKSKSQNRLMQAVAHNPALAKKTGVPVTVAKEFTSAQHGKSVKNLPEKLKAKSKK
jgi:hypothetical protein